MARVGASYFVINLYPMSKCQVRHICSCAQCHYHCVLFFALAVAVGLSSEFEFDCDCCGGHVSCTTTSMLDAGAVAVMVEL